MALDTYTALQATLASWLARADLSGDIPDMIALFEAWVNRNLRMPQMEQEATAQAAEYIALPSDFLEMRDIQWQGSPRIQLVYLTPTMADIEDPYGTADQPYWYTIVGDQLRIIPPPNDTTNIRMAYWKRVPALASNSTNWLLSLYPDAYLYGSLMHGNIRIQDLNMAQAVSSAWQSVMQEMKRQGRMSNVGSLLRMRAA